MDIHSLYKQVRFDTTQNLYNLFDPTFQFDPTGIEMGSYTITREDEMRVDLIYANIYSGSTKDDYENIDVILYINNIYNPLSLKEGMVLIYPLSLDNINSFRYTPTSIKASTNIIKQLGTLNVVPNKTTKQDPSRQMFLESDYSLPPVVLDTPREPVRIENGLFSIGGL